MRFMLSVIPEDSPRIRQVRSLWRGGPFSTSSLSPSRRSIRDSVEAEVQTMCLAAQFDTLAKLRVEPETKETSL